MSWQILRGTGEIVVSLIYASEEVDSGRIIDQIPIRLSGLELHNEWRTKQFVATERLIWNYLKNPSELEELARDQRGVPSYNRRRSPADSELDPNKSIASQFNLLRIADNDKYPAFFSLNGQKFEIAIRKANTEKGESV
jgi:methionyl-tRNA formyltransferase